MPRQIGDYARETKDLSLKELILAKDRCIAKGYFHDDMPIKEQQLVDYEVFYAKLRQVALNGRQITRNVAGSPMVKEGGECICGIYSPEGYATVLSLGVLLHVQSMTEVIRFMVLNDYKENPGIEEGDFFFNNDPHCGGQHSQDQFILTPIFFEGRAVGWVGAMSHEMETGATGPGGYDPQATNRFYEGLILSPTRVATKDVLHTDFRITVEHGTRDATYWLMDTQAKMAGCIHMRESIKGLAKEYGVDFYLEAVQEIIEDGMRATLHKIQSRFLPGKYRCRNFADPMVAGKEAKLIQVNTELTVDKEGHLTIDLEGTSKEGAWAWNGTLPAAKATVYCALIEVILFDCKYNAGSYLTLNISVPEGSLYACSLQSGTSRYIGGAGGVLASCIYDEVGRMNYIAGRRDEVMAGGTGSYAIPFGGIDSSGRPYSGILMEPAAKGGGGGALKDGTNSHFIFWNPEGDVGDAEIYERTLAIKYLGRNHFPDSGGFGKYRGGCSIALSVMCHNSRRCTFSCSGLNHYVPTSQGLMGGYPSRPVMTSLALNTNLNEIFERKEEYPITVGIEEDETEIERLIKKGKLEIAIEPAYPNTDLKDYDLIVCGHDSAAGFGDPLERDPQLVINDLINKYTTLRTAKEIYGVVVERNGLLAQDLVCNLKETRTLRDKMRQERRIKAIPAAQYVAKEKERIIKGDLPKVSVEMINELLDFSPKWGEWFRKEWGLPDDFKRVNS